MIYNIKYDGPESPMLHTKFLLLLTSYLSVFVELVIMNFLALFYSLLFNENNDLIICLPFTLDR